MGRVSRWGLFTSKALRVPRLAPVRLNCKRLIARRFAKPPKE
jgi:hypothetical protein